MKFTIRATSEVTFNHEKGDEYSEVVFNALTLETSKELDFDKYFDKDQLPNREGTKALTATLIQGLVLNIHNAHEKGYYDDAEHLEHIITELQKVLVGDEFKKHAKFTS